MKEIIEQQKVKAFIKKVEIEWRNEIASIEVLTDNVSFNVYLQLDIPANEVQNLLLPKIYMFVDFETLITLHFIDSNFNSISLKMSKDKRKYD
ncbi:hypothetical protein [Pedobacter jeongneungensis]|uniref:hypothetical protein n=1 Tax=Pedobacter jeongneungensis TaxID=947309 RepID=UPI0004690B21|nr:hypothetical protein [Pedobacter jeongneungensis]